MGHPIEESYLRLEQRAAALQALVDQNTDKLISATLQKAYGSLMASASLLLVLEDESNSSIEKALAKAKTSPTFSRVAEAARVFKTFSERYPELLESGVLLSKGKDVEAMKHIGIEALKTALTLAVTLFGGKTIKDAADLLNTLNDLAKTGQSYKFRKKQVEAASDFRKWSEAITIFSIAWSYAVQRYVLDITGKMGATEDEVLLLVTDRMTKCARQWNPK
jgi:hypothetical protein